MLPIAIIAIAGVLLLILPYIIGYFVVLRIRFAPARFESIAVEQIPRTVIDLLQPSIDILVNTDFRIVDYQLFYDGLLNQPPAWAIICQHSSQQIFGTLVSKTKPDIRYPVLFGFSSFWQETHIFSTNIGNFTGHSKINIEKSNCLNKASLDELWISHQSFLENICGSQNLDKIDIDEWKNRQNSLINTVLEIRERRGEIYRTNINEKIYRKHPLVALKMTVMMINELKKKS